MVVKRVRVTLRGLFSLVAAAALMATPAARADQFSFSFDGGGINASGIITVSNTAVSGTDAYEITGISGNFSDTNAAVTGAITGLYTPVSYVSNTLATPGVAFTTGGLSYDDLFYPTGDSPAICYDIDPVTGLPELTYPFSGGQFDIFGVAFNIGGPGGNVGELWSNGNVGFGPLVYAAGLANANGLIDDPNDGPDSQVPPGEFGSFTASPVPEPGSLFLLGTGMLGLAGIVTRKSKSFMAGKA
jgi:hypothetical protein